MGISLTMAIAIAITGLCSTIGFLFGAIWGRKTAYKVIRTWNSNRTDNF